MKRGWTWLRPVLIGALWLASPGCGAEAGADDATASDAATDAAAGDSEAAAHPSLARGWDADGPYRVGYRKLEISYDAGGTLGARTIPVHLWYPTAAESGDAPAPHGGIVADWMSWQDVPAAPPEDGKAWPVMLYTHGHQGFAGSSAFVAWRFASHGWIVAAPDHIGNLLSDAILPRPTWMYHVRPQDLVQTLDRVATLGPADGFEGGKPATDRVALVGHSFGAHDCWAMAGASFDASAILEDCKESGGNIAKDDCDAKDLSIFAGGLRDPRIAGAVVLAGKIHRGLMGEKGHESTKVPVLTMTGTKDDIGMASDFAAIEKVDHTWIELEGATHQSFAVTCSVQGAKDKSCPVISGWSLAFARRHVLDDAQPAALLDGTAERSPVIVRYEQRQP
ncbi:MAG: hypothetical protein H6747_15625 [Deltaproteobacteria bacterium]|nr:hypothetical protein [Deltaproteobacteria bacterium]